MKNKIIITIAIVVLLLLYGCASSSINGSYNTPSIGNGSLEDLSQIERHPDTDDSTEGSAVSEPPVEDLPVTNPETIYRAYSDVIAAIIDEHGIFEEVLDSNGWDSVYPKGFSYGELIDFDQDDIDEMVCVYSTDGEDVLIRVYQFNDNQAHLLLEQKMGIGFCQLDEGGAISFLELDDRNYLIIEIGQSADKEHIMIITTSDEQLIVKEFLAYPAKGRDWWSEIIDQELYKWDVLTNYEVDGQIVSREDFISQYESYFPGSDRSYNVCRWIWLDTFGDISLEQATKFFEMLQG